MWADAGECNANRGFMTNHCKLACKQCAAPLTKPSVKGTPKPTLPFHPAPSNSTIAEAAVDTVQQGVAAASEAAGRVVGAGKAAANSTAAEAAMEAVTKGAAVASDAAGKVIMAGKAVANSTVAEAAANTVQKGAAAASGAAGNAVSAGKDAIIGAVSNATSRTGAEQNQTGSSVLQRAGQGSIVVSDGVKTALEQQQAALANRGDSEDDAPGAAGKRSYDDSQVKIAVILCWSLMCKHSRKYSHLVAGRVNSTSCSRCCWKCWLALFSYT